MTSPVPPALTFITTSLLNCLCAILDTAPNKPVCRCCIRFGDTIPPMDACDCTCQVGVPPVAGNGEAWARIVSFEPFPGATRLADGSVCSTFLQVVAQIGVYRCISAVPGENGEVPSCDQLIADATMLHQDAAALFEAATCCTALTGYAVNVGGYTPLGPSGGCAGGAITVTVDFPL